MPRTKKNSPEQEAKALPDLSGYSFTSTFISMDQPMHLLSPVRQPGSKDGETSVPALLELAAILGMSLGGEADLFSLKQHQERFAQYKFRYKALSFIGYLVIGVPLLLVYFFVLILFGLAEYNVLVWVPTLLLFYISYQISKRMVSIWFDRRYADTLSFVTCLYLLLNLAKEHALARTKDRRQVLARIRALRRYLSLMPYQFSVTDTSSNSWARAQFSGMETFIEEKENQIIAPFANAQIDLFMELRAFLEILLRGNYGDFKYASLFTAGQPVPVTPSRGILGGILRFLGSITPLILLLLLFFFPERLNFLGIENKVISYVSLAWLLLAIDANLKLGIVQGVSSLAKTIKELS